MILKNKWEKLGNLSFFVHMISPTNEIVPMCNYSEMGQFLTKLTNFSTENLELKTVRVCCIHWFSKGNILYLTKKLPHRTFHFCYGAQRMEQNSAGSVSDVHLYLSIEVWSSGLSAGRVIRRSQVWAKSGHIWHVYLSKELYPHYLSTT